MSSCPPEPWPHLFRQTNTPRPESRAWPRRQTRQRSVYISSFLKPPILFPVLGDRNYPAGITSSCVPTVRPRFGDPGYRATSPPGPPRPRKANSAGTLPSGRLKTRIRPEKPARRSAWTIKEKPTAVPPCSLPDSFITRATNRPFQPIADTPKNQETATIAQNGVAGAEEHQH